MADRHLLGVLHIVQAGKPQPLSTTEVVAQHTAARGKGQRVTHGKPQQADDHANGHHTGHGVEHAFFAHHAAVKQGNAGQGHQQHQCGGGHHPGRVRAVERLGPDQAGPGQGNRRRRRGWRDGRRRRSHRRGCNRLGKTCDGAPRRAGCRGGRWWHRHWGRRWESCCSRRCRRRQGLALRACRASPKKPSCNKQRAQTFDVHSDSRFCADKPNTSGYRHKSCQSSPAPCAPRAGREGKIPMH